MGSVIHFVWPGPPEKRAPVKFTAVRTLADGMAEACTKLRLDAGAVHQVTYNKKPVDMSLSFRLANIPAGSSLRMEPASSPAAAPPPPKAAAPPATAAPPPTAAPPTTTAAPPPTTAAPPTTSTDAHPAAAPPPTAAPQTTAAPPPTTSTDAAPSTTAAAFPASPAAGPPSYQPAAPTAHAHAQPPQTQPNAEISATPPPQQQQQQQQQHGGDESGAAPMEGVEVQHQEPQQQQQQQQQQPTSAMEGLFTQQQQQQQQGAPAPPKAPSAAPSTTAAGTTPSSGLSRALGLPREALLLTEDVLHQVTASASSSSIPQAGDDLPDEFFELTPEDFAIWARATEAKKREETAGFKTKAKREQEARAKAEAFASVPVRVRLPGRLVLQAAFAATESLSALHGLLQRVLQPGLAPAVYLYTTPPKQVLKDKDASFYQLGLVPAAHVHLGFDEKKVPSGAAPSQPSDYLLPDALQHVVQTAPSSGDQLQLPGQQTEEELQREQRRKEDERKQARQNLQGLSGVSVGGASSSRPGGSGSSKEGGPKVPKWLKLQK